MGARKQDYGHSFEDYFKRAVNPMLILSLLQERPKYAYEMTQELKERTGGECSIRCSSGFRIRDSSRSPKRLSLKTTASGTTTA